MRYRYTIESRVDMFPKSATYGRIIGWQVVDVTSGHTKSYPLGETGLMLASYPFKQHDIDSCETLARANGWEETR